MTLKHSRVALIGLLVLFGPNAWATIDVVVSIPPLAYFVERIGTDKTQIEVIVGPGASPETYDPTPAQISTLVSADLFVGAGLPIERFWFKQLDRRSTEVIVPERSDSQVSDDEDPHLWLDPGIARWFAVQIGEQLARLLPEYEAQFSANTRLLLADLAALDDRVRRTLEDLRVRKFIVYHPAWGRFARAYDLQQVAIEQGGKPPGARRMGEITSLAKKEGLTTIFTQPQHDHALAGVLAESIGGSVAMIDPLAADYIRNLEVVAEAIAASNE